MEQSHAYIGRHNSFFLALLLPHTIQPVILLLFYHVNQVGFTVRHQGTLKYVLVDSENINLRGKTTHYKT